MPLDTRVVNGRFVVPGGGSIDWLTIHEGAVVAVSESEEVWRTVDASGHLVFPGMLQPGTPTSAEGLPLARSGATTALVDGSPSGIATEACFDFYPGSLETGEVKVISAPDLTRDSELWNLVLDDSVPVHVIQGDDPGFPLIQFLYHEGHVDRGLPLERIAAITAVIPAESRDLYPFKGSFDAGSDGDLFVFDPDSPDPYREFDWPGRVIFSMQRGEILLYNGEIHTSPGAGRRLI